MPGLRPHRLVLLTVLLCQNEVAAVPSADVEWIEVDAGDFVYFSSVSEEQTEAIATAMESFRRELFREGASRIASRNAIPTVVFVFRDLESLDPYSPFRGFAGFFRGETDLNTIALSRSRVADPMPLVYHEFLHYYLSRNYAVIPTWLNEGIAEYYSTYRESRKTIQVGRPVPGHLLSLREDGLMPLAELFTIDDGSPFYNEASRAGPFYAQSWLTAHYLLLGESDGARKVEDFLDRLQVGEAHDEALSAALGYRVDELERRVASYLDRETMSFREWDREWSPEELSWTFRDVPRPEILARLGELQISGERLDSAREHLDEALRLDPECGVAHRGTAMLLAKRGIWAAAHRSYLRAALYSPDDYLTHYRLGRHVLESVSDQPVSLASETVETPPKIRQSRLHLHRAVTLRPDFLEARLWYGYTYLYDPGDPADGIRVLESLVPLYPSRPDVAQNLVLLYLKAGDRERASRMVEEVLSRVADSDDLRESRETVVYYTLNSANQLFFSGQQRAGRELLSDIRQGLVGRTVSPELQEAIESVERAFARTEESGARNATREAQYASYHEAHELSREEQYESALSILEGLLEQDLEPELRKTAEALAALVRYNQAVRLFHEKRYRASLRLARAAAATATDDRLSEMARAIAAACRRELE